MTYSDLFIDFDDTLYDTRGNAIIALRETATYFHLDRWFPDLSQFYNAYWEANVALWAQYAKGEITRPYLIVERFRRPLSVGMSNVTEAFCLEVSDKFLECCADKPGVVSGAHELMTHLKSRGYRMHLCSNGFHEVQYRKLRASNMLQYFDTIILSEDAGSNKPSTQFFDYAFQQSKANPTTTLMIGDNYFTDIQGAMNAHLDTLFFSRWDPQFVPPQSPTFTVHSLAEIINIL